MTVLFVVFMVLFLLGMDLFYSMTVASLAYLLFSMFASMPIPLTLAPQQLMVGVDSFPLLAVPMFLLAGELMSRGGVTVRLVNFAIALVGHIRGGLAQVAVFANIIMSGMSGSAVADLAATGSLLIPSMVKKGYKPEFAAAVLASAATMGPIIPPSLPMVIIGSMVSVSVGKLFLGGVIPGLLMGAAMMVVIYRYAKREGLPVELRATRRQIAYSFWELLLALVMPVVVLGSIMGGYATPTEASVIAVIYALIIGLFIYRDIKFSELPEIFTTVAVTSAAVMVTVAAAQLFGWITAAEGLGTSITNWLATVSTNPYVILLIVNIVHAAARDLDGADPDHAADGAGVVPGHDQHRCRPRPLRCRDDAEPDDRLPLPARWPQHSAVGGDERHERGEGHPGIVAVHGRAGAGAYADHLHPGAGHLVA